MIIKRLRNLWKLSEYTIKNTTATEVMMGLEPSIQLVKDSKQAKYPARILEDDPKEMFEEHEENV